MGEYVIANFWKTLGVIQGFFVLLKWMFTLGASLVMLYRIDCSLVARHCRHLWLCYSCADLPHRTNLKIGSFIPMVEVNSTAMSSYSKQWLIDRAIACQNTCMKTRTTSVSAGLSITIESNTGQSKASSNGWNPLTLLSHFTPMGSHARRYKSQYLWAFENGLIYFAE